MWYKAQCTVEVEVEAHNEDDALLKVDTLLRKRVVGQSFGHERNDRAKVTENFAVDTLTED